MRKKLSPFTEIFEITDAASDGRAVTHHNGQVVFVEGAIPGDIAEVHVFRKQKKILIGRVTQLVKPSPDRVNPPCTHFIHCGGCKWQMMDYAAQLRYKEKQVEDALIRIGKIPSPQVSPIIGSEKPYFYRNKLEFTFSNKAWLTKSEIASEEIIDHRVAGFHVPRIFDKILNIEYCHLQIPQVNEIRNAIKEIGRKNGYSFYDIRANKGFLRNVVFRTSRSTGELMLILIVGEEDKEKIDYIFKYLESRFPEITHLHWIYNHKKNSSYSDLPYRVWKGTEYITEQLGKYTFQISPTSFFQTNPSQAEKLYQVVHDFMEVILKERNAQTHSVDTFDNLFDLYAGTGSIGIFVSSLVKKVVGIEYIDAAVEDAYKNASLNGLSHFTFYAGNMKDILSTALVEKEGKPDVLIADPPRAGMDAKVIQKVLALSPPDIIYVSCQPGTQARDIHLMQDHYEVKKIQPVDMFPQTAHVENVAWLKRKIME